MSADAEQQEKARSVDDEAEAGTKKGAKRARRREDGCAEPAHMPLPSMGEQVGIGIDRDGQSAGPDRDMRAGDADDVEQQWRGQDRAAPADQPKAEAHEAAGSERWNEGRCHRGNVRAMIRSCSIIPAAIAATNRKTGTRPIDRAETAGPGKSRRAPIRLRTVRSPPPAARRSPSSPAGGNYRRAEGAAGGVAA